MIKFYSRNSLNVTHIYGPKLGHVTTENVKAKAAILDGEIVVWDSLNEQFAPFGLNKYVARLNPDSEDGRRYSLCFIVFDILFVKGLDDDSVEIDLQGASLTERKTVLTSIVTEVPKKLEVENGITCSTSQQVFDCFNESVKNNEEGIIIKVSTSTYEPNKRSPNWIKLKSEYMNSFGDTLDLVIVGGYFGETRRIGGASSHWTDHVTVFLLAVIKKDGGADDSVVLPFSKVGTGYSLSELQELR